MSRKPKITKAEKRMRKFSMDELKLVLRFIKRMKELTVERLEEIEPTNNHDGWLYYTREHTALDRVEARVTDYVHEKQVKGEVVGPLP